VQARFDAGEWLRLVEQYRVSSVFVVPTMLQRILDHPDFATADLGALDGLYYGAAAAPVELVRRGMEALPHVGFGNVFGQTETLGAYTTLTPDDHFAPERIGSVGRALPGVEVRVVDPDTGDDVPDGTIGELWVRSDQNVRDGWLHTGDLARRDADGYIYPSGRLTDTINRGGEKFGPIEIESVLRRHPAVADVAAAGVPDAEMGERVGVAVVATGAITAEEVTAFCRQHLAVYKTPEHVVFVDDLPYSDTGKVVRRRLVELIQERSTRPSAGSR
jgi:long-chain acyl-CoA synthetase